MFAFVPRHVLEPGDRCGCKTRGLGVLQGPRWSMFVCSTASMGAQSAKHELMRAPPPLKSTCGEWDIGSKQVARPPLWSRVTWNREKRGSGKNAIGQSASQWLPRDACAAAHYPCACGQKGARMQIGRANGRLDPEEGRRDEPKEERAARESMPPSVSIDPSDPGLHQPRPASQWRRADSAPRRPFICTVGCAKYYSRNRVTCNIPKCVAAGGPWQLSSPPSPCLRDRLRLPPVVYNTKRECKVQIL